MLKNNYHTHMAFCNHAEGMVEDYVKKAIELGLSELGMSDHAPILKEFMNEKEYEVNYGSGSMTIEQIPLYFDQIRECQKKYPQIRIFTGFETEYLTERREYYESLSEIAEYMIVGIHFLRSDKGNVLSCYEELNSSNLYEYVRTVEESLSTGMYTILAHPDLFMFEYKDKNGNWCFDSECEKATRKIAELAIKYDVYLEINCNGLKYCKDKKDRSTWMYPYPKFWEIIKEYPVKLIIGADAHTPDALGNENVKLVCDFVSELGLNVNEKLVIK